MHVRHFLWQVSISGHRQAVFPAILDFFLRPQIVACGKGPPRTGQDNCSAILVGGGCREGLVGFGKHLITLGVQIFGPVKDDLRYLAGLILHLFVFHETPPS